jgi:hypothetical protein
MHSVSWGARHCVISCDLSYAHSESDDAMYALGFFDVPVELLRGHLRICVPVLLEFLD